jgi:hypothetical protein
MNVKTNENEIIRLQGMNFNIINWIEILKERFFTKFQKIKNKFDSVVKKELNDWLFEKEVQILFTCNFFRFTTFIN